MWGLRARTVHVTGCMHLCPGDGPTLDDVYVPYYRLCKRLHHVHLSRHVFCCNEDVAFGVLSKYSFLLMLHVSDYVKQAVTPHPPSSTTISYTLCDHMYFGPKIMDWCAAPRMRRPVFLVFLPMALGRSAPASVPRLRHACAVLCACALFAPVPVPALCLHLRLCFSLCLPAPVNNIQHHLLPYQVLDEWHKQEQGSSQGWLSVVPGRRPEHAA